MSEWVVGGVASLKLLLVVLFATLYWIGGRRWKPIRRFVGGGVIAGGTIGLSVLFHTFHWWFIATLVGYPLALSGGYGAETAGEKIKKRFIYGAGLGGMALVFAFPHQLILGLFQVVLAIVSSVIFGVLNPIPAAEEETVIATLSTVLVPFMV